MTLHFLLQRKQREVAKENEFYYELLIQSLPLEQQEAYHLRNSASHVSFFVFHFLVPHYRILSMRDKVLLGQLFHHNSSHLLYKLVWSAPLAIEIHFLSNSFHLDKLKLAR